MTTCTKCGDTKPVEEFGINRRAKDGKSSRCKECVRVQSAERRAANPEAYRESSRRHSRKSREVHPESSRESDLKRRYGMTREAYATLLAEQGGGCAICGAQECPSGKALAVDHDHACCPGPRSCGKCVRGLLCGNCNRAIGLFSDSPARLTAAAAYLSR